MEEREKVQLALKPAGAQLDFWNVYSITMFPRYLHSTFLYRIHIYIIHSYLKKFDTFDILTFSKFAF